MSKEFTRKYALIQILILNGVRLVQINIKNCFKLKLKQIIFVKLFGFDSIDHEPLTVKSLKEPKESDDESNDKNDTNTAKDEIQIFINSYKFKVGDASGDKAKRDILQCIYPSPDIDCFFTVAQKGAVTMWNNKVLTLFSKEYKVHVHDFRLIIA